MPLPALAIGSLGSLLQRVVLVYIVGKAGQMVLKVFGFFGIAWATNEYLIGPAGAQVRAAWSALPPAVSEWLGFMRVDVCVSMMLSAYAIKAVSKVFLSRK